MALQTVGGGVTFLDPLGLIHKMPFVFRMCHSGDGDGSGPLQATLVAVSGWVWTFGGLGVLVRGLYTPPTY